MKIMILNLTMFEQNYVLEMLRFWYHKKCGKIL